MLISVPVVTDKTWSLSLLHSPAARCVVLFCETFHHPLVSSGPCHKLLDGVRRGGSRTIERRERDSPAATVSVWKRLPNSPVWTAVDPTTNSRNKLVRGNQESCDFIKRSNQLAADCRHGPNYRGEEAPLTRNARPSEKMIFGICGRSSPHNV